MDTWRAGWENERELPIGKIANLLERTVVEETAR